MTTATTWRKERGRETERLVAAYLRDHGWPYAEPVGAGRPGADITGTPGVSIEIKATRACQPVAWLRQAMSGLGSDAERARLRRLAVRVDVPAAVWRADGTGPASIEQWPVIIEFGEFARLLRAAGYGDQDAH